MSWIMLWITLFKFWFREEHAFRVQQLCVALDILNSIDRFSLTISIFEDILSVLIEQQCYSQMITISKKMKELKIKHSERSFCHDQIACALRLETEQKNLNEILLKDPELIQHALLTPEIVTETAEDKIEVQPDQDHENYLQDLNKLTPRTFKAPEDSENHLIEDRLRITCQTECDNCEQTYSPADLTSKTISQIQAFYPGYKFPCPSCNCLNELNMKVKIGSHPEFFREHTPKEIIPYWIVSYMFSQVKSLYFGPDREEMDLMMLRTTQSELVWNLVYHFANFGLPYDFMFPYEDQTSVGTMAAMLDPLIYK